MSGKSTCLVELYRALHKSLTCPIMNRMAQLHEVTIHTRRYNWLIMSNTANTYWIAARRHHRELLQVAYLLTHKKLDVRRDHQLPLDLSV